MAAAAEVQTLLRFLTQDAKVPLAIALPKVAQLRKLGLNTTANIAERTLADVKSIFTDEKVAKQVFNAAKRVSNPKKRPNSDTDSPPAKRARPYAGSKDLESELQLPTFQISEDELAGITVHTNRAPLVLAFAVVLLKYTMPEQPLSSRLSLAQAVVSANSQSKAKSIGLTKDNTAEEEGWGRGQPTIRLLGREIAVMRRAIERPDEISTAENQTTVKEESTTNISDVIPEAGSQDHSSLWGLDLEAVRVSNRPPVGGKNAGHMGLPIHSPQAARNYLLKAFSIVEGVAVNDANTATAKKKPSVTELVARKEKSAAVVLQALDLLYASWASTLTSEELDRRAWSWYVRTRPEVAQGPGGWGQRGEVKLEEILRLRKEA